MSTQKKTYIYKDKGASGWGVEDSHELKFDLYPCPVCDSTKLDISNGIKCCDCEFIIETGWLQEEVKFWNKIGKRIYE